MKKQNRKKAKIKGQKIIKKIKYKVMNKRWEKENWKTGWLPEGHKDIYIYTYIYDIYVCIKR